MTQRTSWLGRSDLSERLEATAPIESAIDATSSELREHAAWMRGLAAERRAPVPESRFGVLRM